MPGFVLLVRAQLRYPLHAGGCESRHIDIDSVVMMTAKISDSRQYVDPTFQ